jgi:hypothetical protein
MPYGQFESEPILPRPRIGGLRAAETAQTLSATSSLKRKVFWFFSWWKQPPFHLRQCELGLISRSVSFMVPNFSYKWTLASETASWPCNSLLPKINATRTKVLRCKYFFSPIGSSLLGPCSLDAQATSSQREGLNFKTPNIEDTFIYQKAHSSSVQ